MFQKSLILFFSLFTIQFFIGCSTPPAAKPDEDRNVAAATSVILDYSAGFQAGWSWVKILSDGTVQHQERKCCPPVVSEIKEPRLSTAELNSLKKLIEDSQNGQIQTNNHVKLGLGQKVGTLTVFNKMEQKILLEDVNREVTASGTVSLNNSPAVPHILNFVQRYAKNIILK